MSIELEIDPSKKEPRLDDSSGEIEEVVENLPPRKPLKGPRFSRQFYPDEGLYNPRYMRNSEED